MAESPYSVCSFPKSSALYDAPAVLKTRRGGILSLRGKNDVFSGPRHGVRWPRITAVSAAIESQKMNIGRATNGIPVFQGKMIELPDIYNLRINKQSISSRAQYNP
jgi:hypothetical protein